MYPNSFRVEVADNGFVIRYDDPDLIRQNRSDDGPYVDPERTAVFPDLESMKAGLDTITDKVVAAAKEEAEGRATDFDDAFAVQSSED